MLPAAAAVVAVSGTSGINMIVDSRASLTVDDGVRATVMRSWPGSISCRGRPTCNRAIRRCGPAAQRRGGQDPHGRVLGQKHLACVTADADLFDIPGRQRARCPVGRQVFLSRDTTQKRHHQAGLFGRTERGVAAWRFRARRSRHAVEGQRQRHDVHLHRCFADRRARDQSPRLRPQDGDGRLGSDLSIAISGGTWSWVKQQVSNNLNNRHTLAVFEARGAGQPRHQSDHHHPPARGVQPSRRGRREQAGASAGFGKVVTGASSSATPSLSLGGCPGQLELQVRRHRLHVRQRRRGASSSVALPSWRTRPTPGRHLAGVQYRTGVTTTLCDWQGRGNASNLMICWEAVEATAGSKVAGPGFGRRYQLWRRARRSGRQARPCSRGPPRPDANLIGLAVDGGTEVTTSTSGTQRPVRYAIHGHATR